MSDAAPIYLDNAATTKPLPAAIDAMAEAHLSWFGNPSSAHDFAKAPLKALEDAREFLRGTLSAGKIVFTSGGTEADLMGIAGAIHRRSPGRVLCAASDHPAILMQQDILGRSRHKLVPLETTSDGDLDPEAFFEHLGRDVRGVAFLHGHNELGTLCELEELCALTRQVAPNAHIHVDLVQTYGKVPFSFDDYDVDSVAVSAHKLHGPRGVGFLALSNQAEIHPLQPAGGQEFGLRGGTENVAGAVGLAVAAEHAFSHLAETRAHTTDLASRLFRRLRETFGDAERLGNPDHRLPHILSMRIPGVVGATLLERMNAHGVAFSTGSACHGKDAKENHVHKAVGLSRKESREILRLSFCAENTVEEIDRVGDLIEQEASFLLTNAPQKRQRQKPKQRQGK